MSFSLYSNEARGLQVPLSVIQGILSAGPDGIDVIILMYFNPYLDRSCKGNTIEVRLNSLTVLTTHFVINLVNYTYSKLVELWPMTLASTNEHSGGTRRKTLMVKKPLVWLVIQGGKPLWGKILLYRVTHFYVR